MMKKMCLVMMVLAGLLFMACDDDSDKSGGRSDYISDKYLDELKDAGLSVYDGEEPPNVTAAYSGGSSRAAASGKVYYANDLDLTYDDEGMTNYTVQYYLNPYNQDGNDVSLQYTNGSDSANGSAYIGGYDKFFSIITEMEGEDSDYGISYTASLVFSAEFTASGMKDLALGFVLTSKKGDDADYFMVPEGTKRIYVEGDGIAELKGNSDYPSSGISQDRLEDIAGSLFKR